MLSRLLFESTWILVGAWVPVQFGLIAIWSWRRTRVWARTVWAGFLTLPVLLVVSSIVITDREQIIAACGRLGSLVENGDVRAIEHMLANDFEAEGRDRVTFIERLERGLKNYRLSDVSLMHFAVGFTDEDVGVIQFHATARVRSVDLVHDWLASRWRLTFHRAGDTWKVTRIDSIPTVPLQLGLGD